MTSFSVKKKVCIGIALLFLVTLVLIRNCNPVTNSSNPSDLQVAKIAQLLNLRYGDHFTIDRFQFVYNKLFHDTMGSCGFIVTLSQSEADRALKSWTESKDLNLFKTNSNLIDWIKTGDLTQKGSSFYYRTVKCMRVSQSSEKCVTWSEEQRCIAFWDSATSNTLIVSTEGDMFLPDAVFK